MWERHRERSHHTKRRIDGVEAVQSREDASASTRSSSSSFFTAESAPEFQLFDVSRASACALGLKLDPTPEYGEQLVVTNEVNRENAFLFVSEIIS